MIKLNSPGERKNKDYRTRNFATIVYEESAFKNWIEVLKKQFIPAFISPLHNLDVNPTGEIKKAHWHVILMFDGLKTKEQAQEVFNKIGGIGCEKVQSLRGYVRYFCHLDNPEKTPYDPTEVISFCGADYFNVIHLVTDRHRVLREIRKFCREQEVYSYSDLVDFCDENRPDWITILDDNTIGIIGYLKSRHWTKFGAKD